MRVNHILKSVVIDFDRQLNIRFHLRTEKLEGGVKYNRNNHYLYDKRITTKDGLTLIINIVWDENEAEYLYYGYNFIFERGLTKILYHYDPCNDKYQQPHINVYKDGEELKSPKDTGFHLPTKLLSPDDILKFIDIHFL